MQTGLTAIWIGGGVYPSGSPEFNLGNDVNAANVVFSSKIELWQVPKNVYEMMPVSLAELQVRVRPYGEIGRYLFDQLIAHSQEEIPRKSDFRTGETWVLGDSPAVGLILYEHRFEFDYVPAPYITQEQVYVHIRLSRPIPRVQIDRQPFDSGRSVREIALFAAENCSAVKSKDVDGRRSARGEAGEAGYVKTTPHWT